MAHTLWVAHPSLEPNSAHKLLGGKPGPHQASPLRSGRRPSVCQPLVKNPEVPGLCTPMPGEPAQLMDPEPAVGDDQGLRAHFVLSDIGQVFQDGKGCRGLSVGENDSLLIIICSLSDLCMCTTHMCIKCVSCISTYLQTA